MLDCFVYEKPKQAIPIAVLKAAESKSWLLSQTELTQNWFNTTQFRFEPGSSCLIPDANGKLTQVVCVSNESNPFWWPGALPFLLPAGVYDYPQADKHFAIAWGLGSYQFLRYKKSTKRAAQLVLIRDQDTVDSIVNAIYLVRDLVNTPADNMGPSELAHETLSLAKPFNATVTQIIGDDLLANNFASIHTVGRASDDAPRLIDLRWGNDQHPKVTLVGKGVCFDTGGLDIKPSSGMLIMKKDMGGAAHVLGLARMIMQANLPVCLRVLIPAVENSISGNAYRPGDVIKSRKGMTIEIGNTDAEGRVVLADAITEAVSEKPEVLIDIATLTGAARVALGTDLPALFSNDDTLAEDVLESCLAEGDPVWRLPLYAPYREALNSSIADINNNTADGFAGAITAALFLKEFVPNEISWMHLDLMAWNVRAKPGRPQGGEALAIRGLFSYLSKRFSQVN
jgi:leucyl aminopeptidase